jgi:hypothetical protein
MWLFAAHEGLINIGRLDESVELREYHNKLMEFVKKCKSDSKDRFMWKYKNHPGPNDLYDNIEKLDSTGLVTKYVKRGHWVNKDSFMLVASLFRVVIFVYNNRKNTANTRSKAEVNDDWMTNIFIPHGEDGALCYQKRGIFSPFDMSGLCILLEKNHFVLLIIKKDNNVWSIRDNADEGGDLPSISIEDEKEEVGKRGDNPTDVRRCTSAIHMLVDAAETWSFTKNLLWLLWLFMGFTQKYGFFMEFPPN